MALKKAQHQGALEKCVLAPGRRRKRFKCKAPQFPRNDSYFTYVAVTRDAAQRIS